MATHHPPIACGQFHGRTGACVRWFAGHSSVVVPPVLGICAHSSCQWFASARATQQPESPLVLRSRQSKACCVTAAVHLAALTRRPLTGARLRRRLSSFPLWCTAGLTYRSKTLPPVAWTRRKRRAIYLARWASQSWRSTAAPFQDWLRHRTAPASASHARRNIGRSQ